MLSSHIRLVPGNISRAGGAALGPDLSAIVILPPPPRPAVLTPLADAHPATLTRPAPSRHGRSGGWRSPAARDGSHALGRARCGSPAAPAAWPAA